MKCASCKKPMTVYSTYRKSDTLALRYLECLCGDAAVIQSEDTIIKYIRKKRPKDFAANGN